IRDIQDDEEQFKEFSHFAEAIWHGDLNTTDFEQFTQTVTKSCPGRKLYPLQLLSAYHLAFSQHGCNFSVPGSGKTTIVLAAFAFLRSVNSPYRNVNHLLIVGPLSSFNAWEEEFSVIFNKKPRAKRITGMLSAQDRRAYLRGHKFEELDVEMTLTSYQSFMGTEEDFQVFVQNPNRRVMMILDEAHYIKRDDGEWASAVLRIAPYATSRIALTGTPTPNGYEDLQNLFRFIHPGRNIVGFPTGTLKSMSEGHFQPALEDLKKRVRPFFTRIRKRDLGLAPIREIRTVVSMDKSQRAIYQGIENLIVPRLLDRDNYQQSTLIRARLIRLRQAATNPSLLLGPLDADGVLGLEIKDSVSGAELTIAQNVERFDPASQLRKIETALQLTEKVVKSEGKVVIWSYFLGNLSLLSHELSECADIVNVISGATPISDSDKDEAKGLESRERIIHQFNTTNNSAILIANPQAVGESISLHRAAHSAIYFDRDFNAAKFIQSRDRIHRYESGGGLPKTYYYIVSEDTVEEVIDQRLVVKEERMTKLIDTDDIPLFDKSLSSDESTADVQAIIRAYEQRKAN
ncbi:MAG: DEAD/DEAH box helicase, partial [Gammaproteobacteria bacterium]|nr:DEAD/DEAH box helicase [Gammaproteobacteria bacterium]